VVGVTSLIFDISYDVKTKQTSCSQSEFCTYCTLLVQIEEVIEAFNPVYSGGGTNLWDATASFRHLPASLISLLGILGL
jgi:hypothetical protein